MAREYAIENQMSAANIRIIRNQLNLSQSDFAGLLNMSVKTVERWESSDKPITGAVVTLIRLLTEHLDWAEKMEIPKPCYPLRLWYMNDQVVCTVIDVDERARKVKVQNYVNDSLYRAFGIQEHPSYDEYEEFLESRCIPRSRDKMRFQLREWGIPYYDPMLIIEKTKGRMAEDNFWIRIEKVGS